MSVLLMSVIVSDVKLDGEGVPCFRIGNGVGDANVSGAIGGKLKPYC